MTPLIIVDTGSRASFRTDAAISKNRFGNERVLQPWVPDSNDTFNGSLEKSSGSGTWDQFAENERLFGLKTNYDENFYTTAIDKSHPEYKERIAAAEKKAREIERSAPTTAHVAEERVMDYVGGDDGGDEEDKYVLVSCCLHQFANSIFPTGTAEFDARTSHLCQLAVRTNIPHQPSAHLQPSLLLKGLLLTLLSSPLRSRHHQRSSPRPSPKRRNLKVLTQTRMGQSPRLMRRRFLRRPKLQKSPPMTPSLPTLKRPRPRQTIPLQLPPLLEVKPPLHPVPLPQSSMMC